MSLYRSCVSARVSVCTYTSPVREQASTPETVPVTEEEPISAWDDDRISGFRRLVIEKRLLGRLDYFVTATQQDQPYLQRN